MSSKGIEAKITALIMGIELKTFTKDNGEELQYYKVSWHDKKSKITLSSKVDMEMEEFLKLNIEEYEFYNITLSFSVYKLQGKDCISCKIVDINPL